MGLAGVILPHLDIFTNGLCMVEDTVRARERAALAEGSADASLRLNWRRCSKECKRNSKEIGIADHSG